MDELPSPWYIRGVGMSLRDRHPPTANIFFDSRPLGRTFLMRHALQAWSPLPSGDAAQPAVACGLLMQAVFSGMVRTHINRIALRRQNIQPL